MQRQLDSKPYAALLAAIVLFSLFIGLGSVPLFDEDEGAYSEVTREMLHSGDFITPRLNGDTFFHKACCIFCPEHRERYYTFCSVHMIAQTFLQKCIGYTLECW